jgi:predicted DsbA family dithiol-disulfide isomerase
MASKIDVTFYFDPICPWSYRTSLWIREARTVRPLEVNWRFLSLKAVNEGTDNLKDSHSMSFNAFRMMAQARRESGNDYVDKLYLAVGRLGHEEKKNISEPEILQMACRQAGVDPAVVVRALDNEQTMSDVQDDHDSGVTNGAFGVASIEIGNDNRPFFGPVISEVPTGERAGELWDHFAWIIAQPEFYEIKRNRS